MGVCLPRRHTNALQQGRRASIIVEGRQHVRRRYRKELAAMASLCLDGARRFRIHGPGGQFRAERMGSIRHARQRMGVGCRLVRYGESYYASSPVADPQGPAAGSVRVRRGGSWHTWSFYARASFRNWNTPQTRYTLVGIRLLREVAVHQR